MLNKENTPDRYNYLIVNYFTSNLNTEEVNELKQWLNDDTAHKRYFDECREVWLAGKLDFAKKDFNARDAFARFKNKVDNLDDDATEFTGLYRRFSLSLLRIAAIFAIAFISGILAWTLINRETPAISYQDITVPAGSKTKIKLPDGTEVWLNSASKLTYSNSYNSKNREVKLEGEGYFKVAEDKNRPFIVTTSSITVQALGTEFNVKSYPDEGIIETTLVEGSVKVNTIENKTTQKEDLILKPNDKLTFIKKTGKLYIASDSLELAGRDIAERSEKAEIQRKEKIIIRTIDPKPLVAWKEDKLVFTGERFEEIMPRLERWYDVSIQVQDPEILTYRFKGSFEKETLEQALEALQLASHFNYTIKKNIITISRKK
jgi:ferric-dicitrate binding protein FerR (iron transport regulator)